MLIFLDGSFIVRTLFFYPIPKESMSIRRNFCSAPACAGELVVVRVVVAGVVTYAPSRIG
ncbi:hypothetical protein HYN24_09305 [Dechloromonas sp. HYN0024]|nr:hypothetical protein HYN24_09305 [Dechloromonas sp. HYN0024]